MRKTTIAVIAITLLAVKVAEIRAQPAAHRRVDSVPEVLSAAMNDATQQSLSGSSNILTSRYVWIPSWLSVCDIERAVRRELSKKKLVDLAAELKRRRAITNGGKACRGTYEVAAAVTLAMNQVMSRSSNPVRPAVRELPGGGLLLRFNFLLFAFDKVQLANLLDAYELLALNEPFILLSKGNLFARERSLKAQARVRGLLAKKNILAEDLAPWAIALDFLQKFTGSQVPVVRGDWLMVMILSTIDEGYGQGIYYELRGIKGLKFKEFLALAGADEALAVATNTDSAAILLKSGVTARQRKVIVIPANKISKSKGYGAAIWTEDGTEKQVQDQDSPTRNPLGHRHAVKEAFVETAGGLIVAGLFEEDGTQVDSAPEDVVHDFYAGVGSGGTRILQAGLISCMRCHYKKSRSYLVKAPNDFRALLKRGGVDIVDDVSAARLGLGRAEAVERLVSLLDVEFENKVFPEARRSYQDAVVRVVGDVWAQEADVKVWEILTAQYGDYAYGSVGARRALQELGISVEDKVAIAQFSSLFRARPGFIADPFAGYLVAGKEICRADFDRLFPVLVGVDIVKLAEIQGKELSHAGEAPVVVKGAARGATQSKSRLPRRRSGVSLNTAIVVHARPGMHVWVRNEGSTKWHKMDRPVGRDGGYILENEYPENSKHVFEVWVQGESKLVEIYSGQTKHVRFARGRHGN